MKPHPGTQGCTYNLCATQDKCKSDCLANWETGMQPIFDEYCECPDATTHRWATSLLETDAEYHDAEAESVDVGAFIQTSTSDRKAEEL